MQTFLIPVPSELGIIKSFSGIVETVLLVHSGRGLGVKMIEASSIEGFLVHLFLSTYDIVLSTYWTLQWNVIGSTIYLVLWTPLIISHSALNSPCIPSLWPCDKPPQSSVAGNNNNVYFEHEFASCVVLGSSSAPHNIISWGGLKAGSWNYLRHRCPLELSMMIEMVYISPVRYSRN